MVRVVDISVIIAVVPNEPQKAALVAQTQGAQLFAPASLPHEGANALLSPLDIVGVDLHFVPGESLTAVRESRERG